MKFWRKPSRLSRLPAPRFRFLPRDSKTRVVLGIETSCDETAAGIVRPGPRKKLLANVLASQIPIHAPYFGVVPELASRAHLEKIHSVLQRALARAGVSFSDAAAVAYTRGPGLKGALLVGETAARALAMAIGKPALDVHHLEAHLAAILFERPKLKPPFLGLIISGGHTDLVRVKRWGDYRVLGRTLDDACGEAFDKFAKMLKLGYPGGPAVDRLSRKGDPERVKFPRPLLPGSWNFSFSGLKTAALYCLRDNPGIPAQDMAASFQEAVCETLLLKTRKALFFLRLREVVVAGGVACNSRLRRMFEEAGRKEGWKAYFPSPALCTDNGAMIAMAGALKLERGAPPARKLADSTLPFTKW